MTDAPSSPPADEPDGRSDPPKEPASPAALPARGKRRTRLRDVADEALKGRGQLMTADPATARIRAIFTGHGVGDDRADLSVLGDMSTRLGRLFTSLTESRPQLFALAFGNSIEVIIGPPEEEIERAAAALRTLAEDPEREALLPSAVPETTLAAYALRELLLESEDDVVAAALSYTADVANAYKTFVRHLADDMLSVRLALPTDVDRDASGGTLSIELASDTAVRYKDALSAIGDEEVVRVQAFGTLTMADSGAELVRLKLDPDAPKHALLRRKRSITARYTRRAHTQIREGNLWDHEVRAEFDMTRDRKGTTAQVRQPTFVLTGAALRYE